MEWGWGGESPHRDDLSVSHPTIRACCGGEAGGVVGIGGSGEVEWAWGD